MIRILALSICIFSLIGSSCKTKAPSVEFSCNLEGAELVLSENCQEKMDCTFTIKNDHKIQSEYYDGTLSSSSVVTGDQMVFVMDRTYQDNPAIADDEFSEKLFFSIPKNKTSFHMEGEDLKNNKMVFATLAYSRDGGYYHVEEGCMEGKLIENGQWFVQGNITITTRTNRKILKAIRANYKIE